MNETALVMTRQKEIQLFGKRSSREEVCRARDALLADGFAVRLLDAMPVYVLILNEHWQVLAANRKLMDAFGIPDAEALIGKRPGDVINCRHAGDGESGCGSTRYCAGCGSLLAVLESQRRGEQVVGEKLATIDDDSWRSLDLEVTATPLMAGGLELTVLAMRDISADKRRGVLERVFFHDLLNTVGGIRVLAEMLARGDILTPDQEVQYKGWLVELALRMQEEINSQRQLVAAERGEFLPALRTVSVSDLMHEVWSLYLRHDAAEGRNLVLGSVPEGYLVSDAAIVRRILGNMLKNALEAIPVGATVTISGEGSEEQVRFSVHNPGVIPADVQLQLFQRSFSTKGGEGRGIGTYSIRLFGERYLGGKVEFVSTEEEGTTFSFTLPRNLPVDGAAA